MTGPHRAAKAGKHSGTAASTVRRRGTQSRATAVPRPSSQSRGPAPAIVTARDRGPQASSEAVDLSALLIAGIAVPSSCWDWWWVLWRARNSNGRGESGSFARKSAEAEVPPDRSPPRSR
jgi:hypothetical protein